MRFDRFVVLPGSRSCGRREQRGEAAAAEESPAGTKPSDGEVSKETPDEKRMVFFSLVDTESEKAERKTARERCLSVIADKTSDHDLRAEFDCLR